MYVNEDALYKREAIRAAKELGYGDAVVQRIKNAKTSYEVSLIMSKARNGGYPNV